MNFLNSKAAAYGVVALIGVAAAWYLAKKLKEGAGDAARAVGEAVNPTSDKNLAYRGVNAVGATITGDDSFSLGGWLYDLTHEEYDPNADVRTPAFAPRSVQVKETAGIFERLLGP